MTASITCEALCPQETFDFIIVDDGNVTLRLNGNVISRFFFRQKVGVSPRPKIVPFCPKNNEIKNDVSE